MKGISRVRQGAVTRVLPNAGSGNVIPKHYPNRAPVTAAPYHYLTIASQNPPAGWIYCASGGLQLRVNEVDAAGQNHGDAIATLKAGDSITIGTQTGVLVDPPLKSGPTVWTIPVSAWPVLADGDYSVTTTRETPALNPPVCSINPNIAPPAQLTLGVFLSCGTGTWRGAAPIAYAYAWQRDGSPIALATNSSYALVAADLGGKTLTCIVTATNADGSSAASSNKIWIP